MTMQRYDSHLSWQSKNGDFVLHSDAVANEAKAREDEREKIAKEIEADAPSSIPRGVGRVRYYADLVRRGAKP